MTRGCRTSRVADATPTVFVVDGDAVGARFAATSDVKASGWRAETFASAQAFLARPRVRVPSCLILDIATPDLDGLEVQRRVAAERPETSVVFTGCADVRLVVRAMKAGAVEVLAGLVLRRGAGRRHRVRARSQPARPGAPGQADGAARLLPVADATRARGDGPGRVRAAQQAGRRRARDQRDHGQGASRPGDAQDEGLVAAGARPHGGRPRPAHDAACA